MAEFTAEQTLRMDTTLPRPSKNRRASLCDDERSASTTPLFHPIQKFVKDERLGVHLRPPRESPSITAFSFEAAWCYANGNSTHGGGPGWCHVVPLVLSSRRGVPHKCPPLIVSRQRCNGDEMQRGTGFGCQAFFVRS